MPKFLIKHQITHEYSIEVDSENAFDAVRRAFGLSVDEWLEEEINRLEPEIDLIEEDDDA